MKTSETPEEPEQRKPSWGEEDQLGGGSILLSHPNLSNAVSRASEVQQTFQRRLQQTLDRLSKAKPGDVQEIAASQIQLLTGYYNLVLLQAGRSFKWALIAAVTGLLFFLAAVTFLIIRQPAQLAITSLISGALIEVISGINFYLYGKTSAQLAEFHSRLDITQRFLLANSLCESLNEESKDRERSALIRRIADIVQTKT